MRESYLKENALAFDKQLNALLFGSNTETLSARAYRMAVRSEKPKKRWRVARRLINALFFLDKDHCLKSYRAGLERRRKYLQRYEESKK